MSKTDKKLDIQKMLVQRLQRIILSLEKEKSALTIDKESLSRSLKSISNDAAARIYLLEEDLSSLKAKLSRAEEEVLRLKSRLKNI